MLQFVFNIALLCTFSFLISIFLFTFTTLQLKFMIFNKQTCTFELYCSIALKPPPMIFLHHLHPFPSSIKAPHNCSSPTLPSTPGLPSIYHTHAPSSSQFQSQFLGMARAPLYWQSRKKNSGKQMKWERTITCGRLEWY